MAGTCSRDQKREGAEVGWSQVLCSQLVVKASWVKTRLENENEAGMKEDSQAWEHGS